MNTSIYYIKIYIYSVFVYLKKYIHYNIIYYGMYRTMKLIWESTSYGYIDTSKKSILRFDVTWKRQWHDDRSDPSPICVCAHGSSPNRTHHFISLCGVMLLRWKTNHPLLKQRPFSPLLTEKFLDIWLFNKCNQGRLSTCTCTVVYLPM